MVTSADLNCVFPSLCMFSGSHGTTAGVLIYHEDKLCWTSGIRSQIPRIFFSHTALLWVRPKSHTNTHTHTKHAVMVISHYVVFILARAHSFALRLWQMELLQQAAKACNAETLFAVQQIPSHIIKPSHTQSYVPRMEVCA